MNNNFQDRLVEAMKKRDTNLKKVSEATKINYEMIRRYSLGLATPRESNLKKICDFLDVTQSWLLFGSQELESAIETEINALGNRFIITALEIDDNYICADVRQNIKSIEYVCEHAKNLFKKPLENIKIANLASDSMQDTLKHGDLLFIDISCNSFECDGIYVFGLDNNLYVRRLQRIKNKLIVISDNKVYQQWEISEKEKKLKIIGKVISSQPSTLIKYA